MNISFASTFRKHLDSLSSNSIKFVFPYLSRCSAVIHNNIAAVATLIFLRAREGGGMDFRNLVQKNTQPLELVFMPVPVRGFAVFMQQDIQSVQERA